MRGFRPQFEGNVTAKQLGRQLLGALREEWRGDLPLIQQLLDAGADVAVSDESGSTPLTSAVAIGNPALVAMILKQRPPLEAQDKKVGWTPLITAAINGYPVILKMLLDAGCNPETADFSGTNAIQHARQRDKEGCADCAQILATASDWKDFRSYVKDGMPTVKPIRGLRRLKVFASP